MPEPEGAPLGHLEREATIEYRHELVRKGIHLFSLSIPVIYYFITRELALWLLVPLTAAFLVVDVSRYYFRPVSAFFYRLFGWLLRQKEQDTTQKRLNGATNVLLSACLCVFLFPKLITITAFAILIVSDSVSALVGRRFGRRKFFDKSLEGSAAFFISALLVVAVTPKVAGVPAEYVIGAVAAAVGAWIESLSIRIDDNLSLPLVVGAVLWGLYALFLPGLEPALHP